MSDKQLPRRDPSLGGRMVESFSPVTKKGRRCPDQAPTAVWERRSAVPEGESGPLLLIGLVGGKKRLEQVEQILRRTCWLGKKVR